jgi:preprotein translocase subunit YajC
MGIIDLANGTAPAKSSSGSFNYILLILIVFVALYFLMIRPQQRRRQQAAQKQSTVAPGAQVRTTAGMYATVVEVDGDDVVLEVAPGIEVRYMKRAIMDVVSPGDPVAEEETYDGDAEDDGSAEELDDHVDAEAEADEAPAAEGEDAETAYEKATGSKKD